MGGKCLLLAAKSLDVLVVVMVERYIFSGNDEGVNVGTIYRL